MKFIATVIASMAAIHCLNSNQNGLAVLALVVLMLVIQENKEIQR
jgi:hypothetical protein